MSGRSSTPARAQPECPRPWPCRSGPGAVRHRRSGGPEVPALSRSIIASPHRSAWLYCSSQRRVTDCDRASRLRGPIKAALIATTRAALNLKARGRGSDRPDHPPLPVNVGQVSFPSPAAPAAARVLEGRPGPASEAARRPWRLRSRWRRCGGSWGLRSRWRGCGRSHLGPRLGYGRGDDPGSGCGGGGAA